MRGCKINNHRISTIDANALSHILIQRSANVHLTGFSWCLFRALKRSRKIFIGCHSMLDTLQSYLPILYICIDNLHSEQKAPRFIAPQIYFRFVPIVITFKELYSYMEKNTDRHKVSSCILLSRTRFYAFMTAFH